ncbi:lytic transglycosylase domain-containing protein [Myroides sp. WP-1]|uniref:lytic transglycosylase domain-containing protein n=1 Tax=Myroides sp. WP-1 TaxID=2759944 RepID=UPI0015FAC40B|nr:lytic transglycosylase domain-containing protein [Myroides sp. WP-1]MBB1140289.1 lytic transglycosylase domain-containing protein [Myroides sp. WP-1]
MKKNLKNVLYTTAVVGVASTFIFATSHGASNKTVEQKDPTDHHVSLPSKANFAGERTPLEIIDVKERFDREMIINANLHSSTTLVIKRAERYFPIIEPILKKNNIPDDFKYLCVIESTLSNVVSSAGASGFWQFMKGTAGEYNLTVDDSVDERYHLEKATEAACRYFNDAKAKFGSWTMVAAAYNRGMAGMTKAMNSQYVDNYYDLFLNQETSRYVFRILAMKEIMSNPQLYGYDIPKADRYQPVPMRYITVSNDIEDLPMFAIEQGSNYKLLKLYNPWLVNTNLKTKGKTYTIELPR